MTNPARALNAPYFTGAWCDQSGALTPLASAVIRALMNRTGYTIGISSSVLNDDVGTAQAAAETAQKTADLADIDAITALLEDGAAARLALAKAHEARDTALLQLARSQAREARLIREFEAVMVCLAEMRKSAAQSAKALEVAQNSAIFALTAPRR